MFRKHLQPIFYFSKKRMKQLTLFTHKNRVKSALLLIMICIGFTAFNQETPKDSIQFRPTNRHFGTEKQISFRVGVGLQKSFYTEIGLALHKCTYGDVGFFSNDFYSTIEWTPNKNANLYGIKVGYEANTSLFLLNIGLELKYQTDFKQNDVVITPKIGLGVFGDINIFYGYSISTNNRPFKEIIGQHQLSIAFNFNNHFLKA